MRRAHAKADKARRRARKGVEGTQSSGICHTRTPVGPVSLPTLSRNARRAAVQRQCDSCGKPYEAQRATSRFCCTTCRSRASRGAVRPRTSTTRPVALLRSPKQILGRPAPTPPVGSNLSAAVRRELEEADRLDTALGQAVLGLAERLESGVDTGSAVASLTRELRATLAEAVAGARVASSPLAQMRDELAERRRRLSG